jgi:type I restriction enzyme M protein
MFEQTFKNIDDVLRKEAGCASELDYTEQTSWLLFLKYLDDLEQERALKAEFEGEEYNFIINKEHRWSSWAVPRNEKGEYDKDKAKTGEDLIDYIDEKQLLRIYGITS